MTKTNIYTRCIVAALFFALSLIATHAQLRVVEQGLNFGKVLWNEPKTTRIAVENAGRMAQTISAVQTDCDCMTATFSRASILPGERAYIDLTFTAPLLGTYRRNVLIYATGVEEPLVATVQASVVSTSDDIQEEYSYPVQIGDISLSTDKVEFNNVNVGDRPQQVIYIKNGGTSVYEPSLMHLPGYITATYEPERVFRGRTGRITLTLNSAAMSSMGLTQSSIYLSRFPGDKVGSDNEIALSAIVHPALQSYTKSQLDVAPVLAMDTATVVFAMDGKRKKKTDVVIANTGRTPLRISSVQVFHPAINISLGATTIRSQASTKLSITLVSEHLKSSKQPLRILLTTNDPKMPQVFINVAVKK